MIVKVDLSIMFLLTISNISNAQSNAKLKNAVVQKISIISTSGKANKSIVEYMDITGKLPIITNLPDNSQNRVLVFNNGCSRTCTGNSTNGTSGEWSYNKDRGTFSCDGVAGALVCGAAASSKNTKSIIKD